MSKALLKTGMSKKELVDFKHFNTCVSPSKVDKSLERFLNDFGFKYDPEIVIVKPELYSEPLKCFTNVGQKVLDEGGLLRIGWIIWQSKVLIEGEYHAVWEKDGELLCITPQSIRGGTLELNQIMFVPTDTTYDETDIRNGILKTLQENNKKKYI